MPDPSDPELLRRIPLSARIVLEVGCSNGDLADCYRRMNPKARLLAIARHERGVPALEQHFDEVVAPDRDGHALADIAGLVDCIIYDHCLEHLPDPMSELRRHSALLAPMA